MAGIYRDRGRGSTPSGGALGRPGGGDPGGDHLGHESACPVAFGHDRGLRSVADQGKHSRLAAAVGKALKGKLSAALYATAIPLAFAHEWIG
ncbi:MAG TPA: hypothetical protein VIV59_01975 [Anaeromyxobacteraceae bacterium]